MKAETPRDLYARLEARLSPLLRQMLSEQLPVIAGRNWWAICVVSSLSDVQRDNMRREKTLEQFDYPALVSIVYKNWKSLRHATGIGNEFTNYLFTLKTFRNDVEHQPDLTVSKSRREHLEQAAQLAEALLTGKTPATASSGKRRKVLVAAAALIVLAVAGVAAVWHFADASGEAASISQSRPNVESATPADNNTVRLKKMVAYSRFVQKGIFRETEFNANYDELTRRLRRIQAHYGMPVTGTPNDELQLLFEQDKVSLELMR